MRLTAHAQAIGASLSVAICVASQAQTIVEDHSAQLRPAGLSVIWQVNGRKLHDAIAASSIEAFSPDGKLVAIGDETGVRVRRTEDGSLVDMFWPGFADPVIYSLAVSSSGEVAIGRVGKVELHRPSAARDVFPYACADDCGPVGAVASRGRLAARVSREAQLGRTGGWVSARSPS